MFIVDFKTGKLLKEIINKTNKFANDFKSSSSQFIILSILPREDNLEGKEEKYMQLMNCKDELHPKGCGDTEDNKKISWIILWWLMICNFIQTNNEKQSILETEKYQHQ